MAPSSESSKIDRLEQRLAADPASLLFVPLGEAYRRAGRLEDAERVLREGLEHHPGHHSARTALARVLIRRDRSQEAAAELHQVLREVPDNLLAQRLLDEAAGPSLDPGPSETLPVGTDRARAVAEPGTGEDSEAAQVATPVIEAPPPAAPETPSPGADELSTVTLAELYLRQGNRERALRIYREVVAREPHQAAWRSRLSELEAAEGPEADHAPSGSPGAPPVRDPREVRLAALRRYLTRVQRAAGVTDPRRDHAR